MSFFLFIIVFFCINNVHGNYNLIKQFHNKIQQKSYKKIDRKIRSIVKNSTQKQIADYGTALLRTALQKNDPTLIKFTLEYFPIPLDVLNKSEETDYYDESPLFHDFIARGNKEIIYQLLKYGADPDCMHVERGGSGCGSSYIVPLHYAIRKADVDLVKLLIDFGANPRYGLDCDYDREEYSTLTLACVNGNLTIVKILLTKYSLENNNSDEYATEEDLSQIKEALWVVMGQNNPNLKHIALALYEKINDPKNARFPLLNIVVHFDDFDHTKALLEAGANPNELDIRNVSPLYKAVEKENIEIAQLLLEKKADPNHSFWHYYGIYEDEKFEDCPLHCAVRKGNIKLVELLLNYGADINKILSGRNVFDIASDEDNELMMHFLQKRKAMLF